MWYVATFVSTRFIYAFFILETEVSISPVRCAACQGLIDHAEDYVPPPLQVDTSENTFLPSIRDSFCAREIRLFFLHSHCVEGHGDRAYEDVGDRQGGDEEVGRLADLAVDHEGDLRRE